MDQHSLKQALRRRGVSSFRVKIPDPETFVAWKTALVTDPRLDVRLLREPEYFNEIESGSDEIRYLCLAMAFCLCMAASLGVINAIQSSLDQRIQEIGTLRALGFGRSFLFSIILTEALIVLLAGILLGNLLISLFEGWEFHTLHLRSQAEVTYSMEIDGSHRMHAALAGFLGVLSAASLVSGRFLRKRVTELLRP